MSERKKESNINENLNEKYFSQCPIPCKRGYELQTSANEKKQTEGDFFIHKTYLDYCHLYFHYYTKMGFWNVVSRH